MIDTIIKWFMWIGIGLGVIGIGMCAYVYENKINLPSCEDFTQLDARYNCCIDCHALEYQYYKHQSSSGILGATKNDCFCIKNRSVMQIW